MPQLDEVEEEGRPRSAHAGLFPHEPRSVTNGEKNQGKPRLTIMRMIHTEIYDLTCLVSCRIVKRESDTYRSLRHSKRCHLRLQNRSHQSGIQFEDHTLPRGRHYNYKAEVASQFPKVEERERNHH